MTQQYDNTNSGALFKNDKKDSERHPDYKGSTNIEGVDYWVSAWIKTGKSGQKFMSLAYTPKEQQQSPQGNFQQPQAAPVDDFDPDTDIPF